MLPQPQILPHISVKGYRELLKRLRQQSSEDTSTSSSLFQQAKELAMAKLQRPRSNEKLNPKRAFSRLRSRLLQTRQDLKFLKDTKRDKLKARYTALKEQRLVRREGALKEREILGSYGLTRGLILGAVGYLSRGFMHVLNSTEIEASSHLQDAFHRPSTQGLVTVSNHTAALDDPLLLAALMPSEALSRPAAYRWGMCATDRCFKSSLMTAFFRAGKTLPVERGAGLEQPGMHAAKARLDAGEWVHIFPEGTRSLDGKMGQMRRGVGHLIAACNTPPVVLPFVHSGMEQILPKGSSLPRAGQTVRILVGNPLSFDDLLSQAKVEGWNETQLTLAITHRIAEALYELKAKQEGMPVHCIQRQEPAVLDSPALMPLIEEQISCLKHSWVKGDRILKDLDHMWPSLLRSPKKPASTLRADSSLHQRLRALQASLPGTSQFASVFEHFGLRASAAKQLAWQ